MPQREFEITIERDGRAGTWLGTERRRGIGRRSTDGIAS